MKAPFKWYGGKARLAKHIVEMIPDHITYVEPFCGAASVFFNKEPSKIEVLNDIHSGITNFYKVLRNKEACVELVRLLELTPYGREEFYFCRNTWEKCKDPIEQARRWYISVQCSFSGCGKTYGYAITEHVNSKAHSINALVNSVSRFEIIHTRLKNIQIENSDYTKVIDTYDRDTTFFYLDPPYAMDTRVGGKFYKNETTNTDHEKLVDLLLNIKGTAILSGYNHEIYKPLEEAGWIRREREVQCSSLGRVNGKTGKGCMTGIDRRTECMWLHPRITESLYVQTSLF